jgi:U32 family peptidase
VNSKLPEILAPVGTWDMCLAAVHNGADAIYVGMPGFNARGRTETISLETLSEMIKFCHLYGVKVFIACNILIFEQELEEISTLLEQVISLSPDALIVQDIGLIRLINMLAPEQVVHASTQMTVSSAEAIDATDNLNIKRFVLARELSLAEIKKIRENTTKELEVFVHGALCVSYSGQCLTSESLGGRSANRGQCAQSCRLPYELIVDHKKVDLVDARYLVSPQDLCSLSEVAELQSIGVDSFKIEGRLKSPEYVASTTRAYKEGTSNTHNSNHADLEVIYSRGFYSGWLHGVNHQELVRADFSSHFGEEVGKIVDISNSNITVQSKREIKLGMGLLFFDAKNDIRFGSNVYKVKNVEANLYNLELEHTLDLTTLEKEMLVFINSAPEIEKKLQQSFKDRSLLKRIPVDAVLSGEFGSKITLTLTDPSGLVGSAQSEDNLQEAKTSSTTLEKCQDCSFIYYSIFLTIIQI